SWKVTRCPWKERCSTRAIPAGSHSARGAGSDNLIKCDPLLGEAGMGRKPRTAKRKTRVGGVDRDEMLRATFDQAAVGMTLVSLDLRYLRVNDKFCEIVGYSRDELLSMGPRDAGEIPGHEAREQELLRITGRQISDTEDVDVINAQRPSLYAGEIDAVRVEKRYLRKDGSVIWVAFTMVVERNAAGEPQYEIAFFDDITSRKNAEAAL